ncbi:SDR family NAD(P)-dependent oxidoreductase [Streptomyces sp. BE230]|uniref:SDR family NAD(P)-dependent oxidoreductase n=1 Tax=Streptomyces sp. BE230 TaxID=3002526 RepID=UPI002ED500D2|nr:SDR family NAD(P)-dependent oxidoreductase [Streptomyces sp. BE230]
MTGGTRGIGLAAVRLFAGLGDTVHLTGRSASLAADRAAEVAESTGASVHGHPLDLLDLASVASLFDTFRATRRGLDVLVANAGHLEQGPVGAIPAPSAERLLDVNVLGTLACVQAAARLMLPRRRGAMVLVGSAVGESGAAGQSAYAASKAAVTALARSAAKELGPRGIRVNVVAPGLIDTELSSVLPEPAVDAYRQRAALRRTGSADEIARVIRFLAGDDASYLTGQLVTVDGGAGP